MEHIKKNSSIWMYSQLTWLGAARGFGTRFSWVGPTKIASIFIHFSSPVIRKLKNTWNFNSHFI